MANWTAPFEPMRQAAYRRIRLGQAPAAAMRQQAINTAGLRTSGVGQLPLIEAARNRALAEAGIEESIAGQEAQQLGAERLAKLQSDLALERMIKQFELEGTAAKTAGREAFQGGLAGLGIGTGMAAFKAALLSKYPWLSAGRAMVPQTQGFPGW